MGESAAGEELLEGDGIGRLLTARDADTERLQRLAQFDVAEHVVGRDSLFNEQNLELGQLPHVAGGVLPIAEVLVGVGEEQGVGAGGFANGAQHAAVFVQGPLTVVLLAAAHLGFEGAGAFGIQIATEFADFGEGTSRPAGGAVDLGTLTFEPLDIGLLVR